MYACHFPQNANPSGPGDARWNRPPGWGFGGYGPPLPIKALAVGVGFLIFKPLGIGLLAWFLLSHRFGGGALRSGFGPWRAAPGATRNSAFEERRRETLNQLDEEAKAFAEFAEMQRQARDKEAFERFIAERRAKEEGAPKA
jgi:hypothetical protein